MRFTLGLAQIARLARSFVSEVYLKDAALQRIQGWLTLRGQLIRQRMAADAAIKAVFALHGVRVAALSSTASLQRTMQIKLSEVDVSVRLGVEEDTAPLLAIATSLRTYIRRLDSKIGSFCQSNEHCRRFLDIPGVGPITAVSFYAAVDVPERFTQTATVGAYFGLTPHMRKSGKTEKRAQVSKMGSSAVRTNLVLSARAMLRASTKRETALRNWGLAIAARAGVRKAEIAVARRLAIVMLTIWKKDAPYSAFPTVA